MWARLVSLVVFLGLAAGAWALWESYSGFRHPPGITVPDQPRQKDLRAGKKWREGNYLVTALAEFEMTGRVLIAERYWTGREADLSPVDLTLAWGPASDTAVLEKLEIYKLERYYRYEWRDRDFDPEIMRKNSANMHMIPGNPVADSMLKSVGREDLVHFKGYLVQVDSPDGWSWASSTTRNDIGQGACEIVWVENLTRR